MTSFIPHLPVLYKKKHGSKTSLKVAKLKLTYWTNDGFFRVQTVVHINQHQRFQFLLFLGETADKVYLVVRIQKADESTVRQLARPIVLVPISDLFMLRHKQGFGSTLTLSNNLKN